MSKIKNAGLDQYGKVQSLDGIGGERVNTEPLSLYRAARDERTNEQTDRQTPIGTKPDPHRHLITTTRFSIVYMK